MIDLANIAISARENKVKSCLDSVRKLEYIRFMWRKEDVIDKLRKDQGKNTLRAYARSLGISAGYLSDIYNNRRDPGADILDHLNIEKTVTVTYTPKEPMKWRK